MSLMTALAWLRDGFEVAMAKPRAREKAIYHGEMLSRRELSISLQISNSLIVSPICLAATIDMAARHSASALSALPGIASQSCESGGVNRRLCQRRRERLCSKCGMASGSGRYKE